MDCRVTARPDVGKTSELFDISFGLCCCLGAGCGSGTSFAGIFPSKLASSVAECFAALQERFPVLHERFSVLLDAGVLAPLFDAISIYSQLYSRYNLPP